MILNTLLLYIIDDDSINNESTKKKKDNHKFLPYKETIVDTKSHSKTDFYVPEEILQNEKKI